MFYFRPGTTAALVPGFLCQSGRRRPENVSILSSLMWRATERLMNWLWSLVISVLEGMTVICTGRTKKKLDLLSTQRRMILRSATVRPLFTKLDFIWMP